jgi:4,5-DOPA dioxygenase extradiol
LGAPQAIPAVFFGHGNPMNAIERSRYTEAWRAFGASIPKPKAALAISEEVLTWGLSPEYADHT